MYNVEDYISHFYQPWYNKILQSGSIAAYMPWRTKSKDDLMPYLARATTNQDIIDSGGLEDIDVLMLKTHGVSPSQNPIYRCGIANQDAFIITRYCLDRLVPNIIHLDELHQSLLTRQ
jgi:hypothetical protein